VTDSNETDQTEATEQTPPTSPSGGSMTDAIKRQPGWVLFAGTAVVLVIGLLIGAVIGWKFEQNRAKDDIKRVRAHAQAAEKAAKGGGTPGTRVVGVVGGYENNLLTLNNENGKRIVLLAITPQTPIALAAPANGVTLSAGTRIVWRNKKPSFTQAAEVVVMPGDGPLGTKVKDATANAMTIGKATINTNGATFDQAVKASPSAFTNGAVVVALSRPAGGGLGTAREVLVLPKGSAFAP
jgi:hypothetical protein